MQYKHVKIPALAGAFALGLAGLQAELKAAVPEIPASAALPVSKEDASKPGFIWNFIQVDTSKAGVTFDNSTQSTEDALAGKRGGNTADPAAQGIASGPGVWLGPTGNSLIQFIIPGPVNLDKTAGSNGNFTPDDQMPGLPGTAGNGTDNIAAEVLYWVEIPAAGTYTFGVNSDDGFRTKVGGSAPKDQFGTVVGEFNGGRGASDTTYKVKFDGPGLYAFRTTYENQGSGANFEMFSVKADGTKVLLNDTANGGLKVFRDISGGSPVYAQLLSPGPGDVASFNAPLSIELVDGSTATVDANSVKLTLDSTAIAATVKKTGTVTAATYTAPANFPSGSQHTLKLDYTAGGTAVSKTWSFSTVKYASLSAVDAVQADTTKPGFLFDYFQNEANTANDNITTEVALAGQLKGSDGALLPNNADISVQGVASGAGKKLGTAANSLIEWEIPTVINMDKAAGGNGNFQPDDQMPGAPGTTASTDGQKAQILTYLDLPKGVITMGVNSDDGFRATAGQIKDIFASQFLGEYSGGRGASDSIFSFVVNDAGIYPFRVTWENGGGGSNIEWFSVKPDGTKVLINDIANGGIKAYRAKQGAPTPDKPYITAVSPSQDATDVSNSPTITASITDGGKTTVDKASVKMTVDGTPVTAAVANAAGVSSISYTPSTPFQPSSTHTVALTFADSAAASRTASWSFTTTFITADTLFIEAEDFDYGHGKYVTDKKIGMNGPYDGGSYAGLGTADDEGFDFHADGPQGQTYRPDTNIAAGKENGSAGNNRGYFTVQHWWTVGWNDAGEWENYTRDFPTPAKDYEVFGHLASGGAPIMIELDQVTAGQGQADASQTKKKLGVFSPGRATAGWDSLEVFQLTDDAGAPATVNLGGKTTLRVTMLPGSAEDMDYFAFRPKTGVSAGGNTAVFSSVKVSADHKSLALTFTGTLQSADVVTGPWIDVPNASSPATVPVGTGKKFFRVH